LLVKDYLTDKGKPVEKQGRKAKGLRLGKRAMTAWLPKQGLSFNFVGPSEGGTF